MYYNEIVEFIKNIYLFLNEFNPEPTFLSDIVAVEAVVIAIAIPLSFEIISRISERYQSEVISNRFTKSLIVIWIARLLILNIIFIVFLRFFINDNPLPRLWKQLAWIAFIGFLISTVIFWKFILRLNQYMTGTKLILKELYNDAEKFFK